MLVSSTDNKRQQNHHRTLRAVLIFTAALIAVWMIFAPSLVRKNAPMPRPTGMAPQAFKAYLHACRQIEITPERITQTIGDSPNSFGYHFKDGILKANGQRIEYCAATDFHTADFPPQKIENFVRALGNQGFACWYRHGGKWQGIEHIHAVYAFVPMKAPLQKQVKLYLRQENPHWAKKWRRKKD